MESPRDWTWRAVRADWRTSPFATEPLSIRVRRVMLTLHPIVDSAVRTWDAEHQVRTPPVLFRLLSDDKTRGRFCGGLSGIRFRVGEGGGGFCDSHPTRGEGKIPVARC
jgi:hypothetical protein